MKGGRGSGLKYASVLPLPSFKGSLVSLDSRLKYNSIFSEKCILHSKNQDSISVKNVFCKDENENSIFG